MISSHLNPPFKRGAEPDGRFQTPDGELLVEVKRTDKARDIRVALMGLVYLLGHEPPTTKAVCVLSRTRLPQPRLEEELALFRSMLRPDLAARIFMLHFEVSQPDDYEFAGLVRESFVDWLDQLVRMESRDGRVTRHTVVCAIASLWLRGELPMTSKALQEFCGASYPTVAAAVQEYQENGLLEEQSDRRIKVRGVPASIWLKMAEKQAASRTEFHYIYPGPVPAPELLCQRVQEMQKSGRLSNSQIGVGGVIGAKKYFPDLDVSGSPKLDLSYYRGTSFEADLDFVGRIDPLLRPREEDERERYALTVHVTSEPLRLMSRDEGSWASEMECVADLLELGLSREAHEMMTFLGKEREAWDR